VAEWSLTPGPKKKQKLNNPKKSKNNNYTNLNFCLFRVKCDKDHLQFPISVV